MRTSSFERESQTKPLSFSLGSFEPESDIKSSFPSSNRPSATVPTVVVFSILQPLPTVLIATVPTVIPAVTTTIVVPTAARTVIPVVTNVNHANLRGSTDILAASTMSIADSSITRSSPPASPRTAGITFELRDVTVVGSNATGFTYTSLAPSSDAVELSDRTDGYIDLINSQWQYDTASARVHNSSNRATNGDPLRPLEDEVDNIDDWFSLEILEGRGLTDSDPADRQVNPLPTTGRRDQQGSENNNREGETDRVDRSSDDEQPRATEGEGTTGSAEQQYVDDWMAELDDHDLGGMITFSQPFVGEHRPAHGDASVSHDGVVGAASPGASLSQAARGENGIRASVRNKSEMEWMQRSEKEPVTGDTRQEG
ncbi:MAG: hypothetical protein KDA99_11480 [Planctomycetales bacterium]|nr:hypothetical protein [Planctomycetales bacterium]